MRTHLLPAFLRLLAADDHGGGSTEPVVPPADPVEDPKQEPSAPVEPPAEEAPRTLKAATELLGKSRAAMADLTGKIAALTGERDQVKAQFETLVAEATQLKGEIARLTGEMGGVTASRDEQEARALAAEENVARLEKLCGVRGVDPKAAATSGSESPAAVESDPYAAYCEALEAGDKAAAQRIYSAHKAQIFKARSGRK